MNDFTKLPDSGLEYLIRQLEAKVAALRSATSAIGVALYQQFVDRLDQLRAEQERRRV
jgi:hypothetical protein